MRVFENNSDYCFKINMNFIDFVVEGVEIG